MYPQNYLPAMIRTLCQILHGFSANVVKVPFGETKWVLPLLFVSSRTRQMLASDASQPE